eukprot:TRINITY_DN29792_c0_g1_i1.p1 TRINITY_DN29792_c0_g1~~TRINITY_DN29792_c0_g1_i1.p1  ORF type:complete len:469 (+),score=57.29 TRINITY_DN29792_c0_g1_i1:53-1408(+)
MAAEVDIPRAIWRAFERGDPRGSQPLWFGTVLRLDSRWRPRKRLLCVTPTGLYVLNGADVTRCVPHDSVAEIVDLLDYPNRFAAVVTGEHDLVLAMRDRTEKQEIAGLVSEQRTRGPPVLRNLDWQCGETMEEALMLAKPPGWSNATALIPHCAPHSSRVQPVPAVSPADTSLAAVAAAADDEVVTGSGDGFVAAAEVEKGSDGASANTDDLVDTQFGATQRPTLTAGRGQVVVAGRGQRMLPPPIPRPPPRLGRGSTVVLTDSRLSPPRRQRTPPPAEMLVADTPNGPPAPPPIRPPAGWKRRGVKDPPLPAGIPADWVEVLPTGPESQWPRRVDPYDTAAAPRRRPPWRDSALLQLTRRAGEVAKHRRAASGADGRAVEAELARLRQLIAHLARDRCAEAEEMRHLRAENVELRRSLRRARTVPAAPRHHLRPSVGRGLRHSRGDLTLV